MNYLVFFVKVVAFAITLFLALEFIVSCDTPTWKAGIVFGVVSVLVIIAFFATRQHDMIECPVCSTKISPVIHNVSDLINTKISKISNPVGS